MSAAKNDNVDSNSNSSINIGGWMICSNSVSISATSEIDEFFESTHIRCPEMVYLNNYLILRHLNSQIEINFNTRDALKGCLIQNLQREEEQINILQTAKDTQRQHTDNDKDNVNSSIQHQYQHQHTPIQVTYAKQWADKSLRHTIATRIQ